MARPVRIKICGITRPEDLADAVAAGANAVGLNFYPPSPRYLAPDRVRQFLAELPPFVEPVAVFVGGLISERQHELKPFSRIRTFQIHGAEPEIVSASHLYIPAFAVRDATDLSTIHDYLSRCREARTFPAAILIDGHAAGLAGGTGHTAPWDLLANITLAVPLILAGGLTPDNVAEAIRRVRPYAVDVASGVESAPGIKDRDRMRRFIDQAQEAADQLDSP